MTERHSTDDGPSVVVDDRMVPARVGYYAFGGRRHLVVWAHQNRDGVVLRTWCGLGHTASIEDATSARRPCPVCAACRR
ncbi:hypothetical protein [Amycolatopsis arida]|nr:hypothetical protein [Amycolatopsis arida]